MGGKLCGIGLPSHRRPVLSLNYFRLVEEFFGRVFPAWAYAHKGRTLLRYENAYCNGTKEQSARRLEHRSGGSASATITTFYKILKMWVFLRIWPDFLNL